MAACFVLWFCLCFVVYAVLACICLNKTNQTSNQRNSSLYAAVRKSVICNARAPYSVFDNGWQEPLNAFPPNSHEYVFGPSLGQVRMSRSRSPGTKNVLYTHNTPQYGLNGRASLQITSRKQQARRCDRWRGVSSPACITSVACAEPGGLLLGSATHFYLSAIMQVLKLW